MQPEQDKKDNYDVFKYDVSSLEVAEESTQPSTGVVPPPSKRKAGRSRRWLKSALITLGILALVGVILLLSRMGQKPDTTVTINTQSLDNGTLNQLTGSNGSQSKQQLTISPDTLFKNDVTIQKSAHVGQDLTVDGKLTVKGQSLLQGPTTIENSLTVRNGLTASGNTALGGNLSVNGQISAASLTVGALTISSINLSSDIVFGGHLVPNGDTPTVKASVASGNGTATVSGNDSSGTIVINIGNGALNRGEMVILTFRTRFGTTPKVQLTPINEPTSNLNFYASRNPGFFTINTSTTPAAGASYVFDYLVTQ